jgi:hypothetical protein
MTEKHYPPIPGKIGKRGRPSREEMEERRIYWEARGGAPKSVQEESKTDLVSTLKELVNLTSNKTPAEMPKKAAPTVKIVMNDNVPEDIQKLIENSPVPLEKSDKKLIDELLKTLPPPKRGRPSVIDQATRQSVKDKINTLIVDKIKQNGGLVTVPVSASIVEIQNGEPQEDIETVVSNSVAMIGVTQFRFGDRVKPINSMTGRRRKKGIVQRHDIGSAFAFIRWNGGQSDWCRADTIASFNASKEDLEEIMKEDSDSSDDE